MYWLDKIPKILTAIDTFINFTYFDAIDLIKSEGGIPFENSDHMGAFTSLDQYNLQGLQPLHYAISLECPSAVDWILKRPSVQKNAVTETEGWNAAHLAVRTKQGDILSKLINEHGVDLNALDNQGLTPLSLIESGEEMKLHLWIYAIVPPRFDFKTSLGPNRRSYFHYFARDQTLGLLNHFIEHNFEGINRVDDSGTSALMLAAENGQIMALRTLLQKGADFSVLDGLNRSVLYRAAASGQAYIVKTLLDNSFTSEHLTEEFTAEENEIIMHNLLLIKEKESGFTPLHIAVINNNLEVVKEILSVAFSEKFIDLADSKGDTALHFAVHVRSKEIVSCLLMAGASEELENDSGQTPLQLIDPSDLAYSDILAMLDLI